VERARSGGATGTAGPAARYTFGDDERAARRLALVADVFEASSRALLGGLSVRPRLALDLGCGPGFSTALVATATGAATTVGLDRSEAFVAAARAAFPGLGFVCHDVTTGFPTAPPDLVFARLLLAHLPEPAARARAWARGLAPGGRLVLEEMEGIDAPAPPLAEYEEKVLAVVEHQGAPMYAGPLLTGLGDGDGLRRRLATVRRVAVPTAVAARIYGLNLDGWRHDPFATARFEAAELDALRARLAALAREGDGDVGWRLRQLVLERPG
jgi:SAM-dependent methyltransferase